MMTLLGDVYPDAQRDLAATMALKADAMQRDGRKLLGGAHAGMTPSQMDRAIEIITERWRAFAAIADRPAGPVGGGLAVIVGGKAGAE